MFAVQWSNNSHCQQENSVSRQVSKFTRGTRSYDCLFWTHNLSRCQVPSHISFQGTCVQTGRLKNYKSNVVLGTHDSPYCFRDFNLLRVACSGYNNIPSSSVWHNPVQQVHGYKIWVLRHPLLFLTITATTSHNWLAASYEKPWTLRPQDPAKRWKHSCENSKYHYICPFHFYKR